MGIDATLAYFIARTTLRAGVSGSVCTLGVQDLRADDRQIAAALAAAGHDAPGAGPDLFARLGFDRVETLDVSSYEGCTHLVDLNDPGVPVSLRERFDVVYNGGTLEHVFDVRAALRNIFELLRVGGIAIHVVPSCGWLDHGFYQISPTLLTDYYGANHFELLDARVLACTGPDAYVVRSYHPDAIDGSGTGRRVLFYAAVRKRAASTWAVIPHQRHYAALHGLACAGDPLPYEIPFHIRAGVPLDLPGARQTLPRPAAGAGFEWTIALPQFQDIADGPHGSRSPLVLFEDDRPIGPPHASHADIRSLGGGRYSHWGNALHFSTAGHDDAGAHVYSYALIDSATVSMEQVQ